MLQRLRVLVSIGLLALLCCASGCSTLVQRQAPAPLVYQDPATGIVVSHGRPAPVIDGIGWVLGTPSKLALWDRRADNHQVSDETLAQVLHYLDTNELNHVWVDVNRYDPLAHWRRLTSQDHISPGWRYTAGIYTYLKYTLFPGRILGGDWYNPFTNTVHVYSDIAPLAMARAAYAKDVHGRRYPGAYAASQELPIVGMMHETTATADAMAFTRQQGNADQIAEAERILVPDYGALWGGQLAAFLPYGTTVGRLAGAAVGHSVNAVREFTSQTFANGAEAEADAEMPSHQPPLSGPAG